MAIQRSEDPESFKDFEHQGWETVSTGYERYFGPLTRQCVPATLDAAGVTRDMRLLDVCTGPGMSAQAASALGAEVVGLDFSNEFIKLAACNVPAATFHQCDAQALAFADDSFDAVVCGYGLIHLPDPERALSEMRRVLRPGGRLAISAWDAPNPSNGFGILYGALKQHGDLSVPLPHGPDFFQFSERETMLAALRGAGLRDLAVRSVEQYWDLKDGSGIIQAVLEGAVRARALFLAQTDSVRAAIEASVKDGMAPYAAPNGRYLVPMPALVGSGAK